MTSTSRALLVASLLLVPVGCDDGVRLSVGLRTDFVPGAEFFNVRTVAEAADGTRRTWNTPAFVMDDVVAGARLVDFEGVPRGAHVITVALQSPSQDTIAERRLEVTVEDGFTVTALIARDCVERTCPDGTSACQSDCDDPRCSPETPEFCSNPGCTSATDCDAPVASCAMAECVLGSCFDVASATATCAGDQFCVPESGCADYPMVIAPDAGTADAGVGDAGQGVAPPTQRAPANGTITGLTPGLSGGVARPKLIVEAIGAMERVQFDVYTCSLAQLQASDCGPTPFISNQSEVGLTFLDLGEIAAPGLYGWRASTCDVAGTVCGAPSEMRWFRVAEPNDIDADGEAEVIVSAPGAPDASMMVDYGHLYVFDRAGTAWVARAANIEPPNDAMRNRDALGLSLDVGQLGASAQAQMVVGAPLWTRPGGSQHDGRVLVVEQAGTPDTYTITPLQSDTPQTDARFGAAVAILGDIDTDADSFFGEREIAIGEPRDPATSMAPGRVHVFRPAPGGGYARRFIVDDPVPTASGGFGSAVIGCDLDGDGIEELVVSAPQRSTVYAFTVAHGTLDPSPLDTFTGSGELGTSLACADLNKNGRADLILGAPDVGQVTVVFREDGVPDRQELISAPPGAQLFGYAVDVSDADVDGRLELHVLAPLSGQVITYEDPAPVDQLPTWGAVPTPDQTPPVVGHAEGCLARMGYAGSDPSFQSGVVFSHVPTGATSATMWLAPQSLMTPRPASDLEPAALMSLVNPRYGRACR